MARNKFIYAQSVGTVIVRSEKKGGTWTGANENLRNGWCASFCWNKPEYDGNQELIRLGCIPIDDVWDGNPEQSEGDGIKKAETVDKPADGGEQLLIRFKYAAFSPSTSPLTGTSRCHSSRRSQSG